MDFHSSYMRAYNMRCIFSRVGENMGNMGLITASPTIWGQITVLRGWDTEPELGTSCPVQQVCASVRRWERGP